MARRTRSARWLRLARLTSHPGGPSALTETNHALGSPDSLASSLPPGAHARGWLFKVPAAMRYIVITLHVESITPRTRDNKKQFHRVDWSFEEESRQRIKGQNPINSVTGRLNNSVPLVRMDFQDFRSPRQPCISTLLSSRSKTLGFN